MSGVSFQEELGIPAGTPARPTGYTSKYIAFRLTTADLAFYNQEMKLVTEPGRFEVWIAPDAERGIKGEIYGPLA